MEAHIGLELDIIKFPEETKKKILEIRNDKIRNGEENWTCTDVLVLSVNMAYELHKVQKYGNAQKATKQQVLKPEVPLAQRFKAPAPDLTAKQGDGNGSSETN